MFTGMKGLCLIARTVKQDPKDPHYTGLEIALREDENLCTMVAESVRTLGNLLSTLNRKDPTSSTVRMYQRVMASSKDTSRVSHLCRVVWCALLLLLGWISLLHEYLLCSLHGFDRPPTYCIFFCTCVR
mmetsp:Transcript_3872/g.8723  ORF Transcript_3872/g.8723 Transcript_3872/m.8723 type:complete len:129 (+) Transcript_3872:431-817(+)